MKALPLHRPRPDAQNRAALSTKEFGHFIKKVAARRQELADQWGREEAMVR